MYNKMRRITKKLLIFLIGVLFIIFFCEFLIYFLVIAQCSWPLLNTSQDTLKVLMISDTHLLGPRKGHWLDKWRREWQMHQAFQAIITLHKPDTVFVLGDLFDEGEWSSELQLEEYVSQFKRLFPTPEGMTMHVVAGNHDIGFHNYIRRQSVASFTKLLNSPPVHLMSLKGSHFVFLNSMAMEGDGCRLCEDARKNIMNISETLGIENSNKKLKNFSYPILIQHFPLYRLSDAACTEPDAAPLPEKNKPFRLKIDALSKESTQYLVSNLKPRVAFGGHTHHGCLLHHSYKDPDCEFDEYTIPSFSWRNRPDPKYMLVTIASHEYAVRKCGLPRETTIAFTAVLLLAVAILITFRKRMLQRRFV